MIITPKQGHTGKSDSSSFRGIAHQVRPGGPGGARRCRLLGETMASRPEARGKGALAPVLGEAAAAPPIGPMLQSGCFPADESSNSSLCLKIIKHI